MRRRRRPASIAITTDTPMHALNTTPLIDVMLVLLVMMIEQVCSAPRCTAMCGAHGDLFNSRFR